MEHMEKTGHKMFKIELKSKRNSYKRPNLVRKIVLHLFVYSGAFLERKWGCGDFDFLLHFSQKPWYTAYEVRIVQFRPFVYDAANHHLIADEAAKRIFFTYLV